MRFIPLRWIHTNLGRIDVMVPLGTFSYGGHAGGHATGPSLLKYLPSGIAYSGGGGTLSLSQNLESSKSRCSRKSILKDRDLHVIF